LNAVKKGRPRKGKRRVGLQGVIKEVWKGGAYLQKQPTRHFRSDGLWSKTLTNAGRGGFIDGKRGRRGSEFGEEGRKSKGILLLT